jgi:hypothetical protein
MSTRDELEGKVRPARKAGNLSAIREPIYRKYGSLDISQHYMSSRPITGIIYFLHYYQKYKC